MFLKYRDCIDPPGAPVEVATVDLDPAFSKGEGVIRLTNRPSRGGKMVP